LIRPLSAALTVSAGVVVYCQSIKMARLPLLAKSA
jgi:hypothetical protein